MSNTKKIVLIITAVFLVCLIGAGIVVGIFYNGGNDFSSFANIFGGSKFEIDESEVFDLSGVTALSVDCTSGDIHFVESDETKATLTGTMISKRQLDQYLNVYEQGGTLYVKVEYEQRFFNIHTNVDLTVYLPSDNMLDLAVDTASGDIDMADMRFGDVVIDKTSGDTKIDRCTAKSMRYNSSSGNTQIADSDLGSINIISTSGDINIMRTPGAITVRSTSGRVNIDGADGTLDIGSTSGDVTLSMASVQISPINVGITSGDLRLYMSPDSAFDLAAKTTSGDISSDMEISVSGALGKSFVGDDVSGTCNGGGALVSVNTTSGDIRIIEK